MAIEEAIGERQSESRPAAETSEVAIDEAGTAAAEIAPAKDGSSESKQQGERVESDRNFRGDRRGRRSRRRRSRGRGFPDTKYAQPPIQGEARDAGPMSEAADADDGEEQVGEVMVLPGESLAKYRGLAGAEQENRHDIEEQGATEFQSEGVGEEDIDAEAERIELADKVLSHHDDETEAEEEEKLETVKQDQPGSPFVVNDIETDEEPGARRDLSAMPTDVRSGREVQPLDAAGAQVDMGAAVESEPAATVDARTRSAGPDTSDEIVNDPDVGLSAGERAEDEIGDRDTLEDDEFDGAEPEDAEPANVAGGSAPEAIGNERSQPAQSASVREQGGRYMHRVSRRMRRRRGAGRFARAGHDNGHEIAGSSMPTGTGAAVQPESRADFRREAEEEFVTERPDRATPSITELLKPGQEIIVQIAKEPLGQKGARITSHVALPGRYVVFMPSVSHLGVSRKIASDEERQRLKRILQAHRVGTTGGFIVRTAGEGVPENEIAADMDFLYRLWLDIRQKAEKKPAPALLHYDLDIVQRILRDQVTHEFKAIWVDNEDMYENVVSFLERFQPTLVNRAKMYTRPAPIFDAFGITQELEKALRPKVWLKSGGYIVINQTEALVAIDINTGKYVGKSNRLEDTIVKTNTEAVKEIVRQIRLRDLGGIIVVDFIDMDERKNRQRVMQVLEEAMRADRAPYKILQFNDFGLVAITRKRVKQSLERTLCSPCPYCEGAGYVKSVQTVIGEILTEAQKIAKAIDGKDAILRVHPEVAKLLKGHDNRYLEELEEILGRPVLVKGDAALHHEKFDLG